MAWLRPVPRALAAVLAALLLAGCASPPSASQPTGDAPASPAEPTPKPRPAPQAPTQAADLAWSAPLSGCLFGGPPAAGADPAFAALYAPESKGVLYDAAPVDRATWGAAYNATFQFQGAGYTAVLLFWNGTVGQGKVIEEATEARGLADPETAVWGDVPPGADAVSATGCGGAGTVRYRVGAA